MLHSAEIGHFPQTKLSYGICDVNHAVPNSTNYAVDLFSCIFIYWHSISNVELYFWLAYRNFFLRLYFSNTLS